MILDLNVAVAIFVGLMALCAFILDIITSPHATGWMALPPLIRWQVRITATVFMIRSVDLFSLAKEPGPVIGQVNWLAFFSSFCMACTVVSLTFYAARNKLPGRAWERLNHVLKSMRLHPRSVPVMMDMDDVTNTLHAVGQPATGPSEGGQAVLVEVARAGRVAERAGG